MFANHSVADVLAWINKGMQIQQQDDALRAQSLSAEHHLLSGFVGDQCEKAAVLAQSMTQETACMVHAWVDAILNDVHYLEPLIVGTLRVTAAGDDEGKNILIEGGGELAEIQYETSGKIKTVQIGLADGLMMGGRDRLWRALVGECTWGLHHASQPAQILQDAILLAANNQWSSIRGTDQREVVIPEGAAAVVEVGLYGSIKVLWSEPALGLSIKEDGYMEIFDQMSGLAPGRYLCSARVFCEDSEVIPQSFLLSEITGYRLLIRDQVSIKEVGDEDWLTPDPGIKPAFSESEEEEFVLVRLHSGDVLHPMHPSEIEWGAMGMGTVAQYKSCKSATAYDLALTRRLLEIFDLVQSQRPFLSMASSYTRNEDWVIEIEDRSPEERRPLKVGAQHTDHRACHSKAIQQLLQFVDL